MHTPPEVPPRLRTSSGVVSSVMSPLNASVFPLVISLDVPVVPHADVPVTHPHIVTHIGDSEVTSFTGMEDLVVAHMSFIYKGIHTSSFVKGEVHSTSESDDTESDPFI